MMGRPLTLVVDTETTGVSALHDRVCEVAVILTDGVEVYASLETLVRPPQGVSPHEKSQIDARELAEAPPFADIALGLHGLMALADEWVGYGLAFDTKLLGAELSRCGLSLPERRHVDVLAWHRGKTLRVACEAEGITFASTFPWHRAFADCVATLRLWRKVRERGETAAMGEAQSIGVRMR